MTSISGNITYSGSGLQYVECNAIDSSGEVAATDKTDAAGDYTITGLTDTNTYTVNPRRPGYKFTPETQDVTLSGDETGIDFTAETLPFDDYGVPGSSEIQWSVNETPIYRNTFRGEASATIWDDMVVGLEGNVSIDGTIVFAGMLNDVKKRFPGQRTDYRIAEVTFHGWEQILRRRSCSPSSGGAGTTVQDVIDGLQTEVLNDEEMAEGTIDNSSTAATEDYSNMMAGAVLDDLAAIIGGYWYIEDWPMVLNLREYGSPDVGWSLSTSAAVRNLSVRFHRDEYHNHAYAVEDDYHEYDDAEISDRVTVEGGTGQYDRLVDQMWEAQRVISGHSEMGREIVYDTHKTGIRPGMGQVVNLESEFGITDGTEFTVTNVVAREEPTTKDEWIFTVTLSNIPRLRGWQRQIGQLVGWIGTVRRGYAP